MWIVTRVFCYYCLYRPYYYLIHKRNWRWKLSSEKRKRTHVVHTSYDHTQGHVLQNAFYLYRYYYIQRYNKMTGGILVFKWSEKGIGFTTKYTFFLSLFQVVKFNQNLHTALLKITNYIQMELKISKTIG